MLVTPIARTAARVLPIDRQGRVLLLRGRDPAAPDEVYWFTVGGGLDAGETAAAAAARELYEETGLRLEPATLGAPVFADTTEFGFDGRTYRQDQEFFAVRVEAYEPLPVVLDAQEHAAIIGYRWWTPEELATTLETYYPPDLPDILRRLEV